MKGQQKKTQVEEMKIKLRDVERKTSMIALNVARDLQKLQEQVGACWNLLGGVVEVAKLKGLMTEEDIDLQINAAKARAKEERLVSAQSKVDVDHKFCENCYYHGADDTFNNVSDVLTCPKCNKTALRQGAKSKEVVVSAPTQVAV